MAYLPSRMGVAGTAASGVLQGFLEKVLVINGRPDISHPPTREALHVCLLTAKKKIYFYCRNVFY